MIESNDLLQVAHALGKKRKGGAPKRADLRRAVSTAYYAVFHFLSKAAADALVGSTKSGSAAHTIVYRAFEHRRMHAACREASKQKLDAKLSNASGFVRFDESLRSGASAFVELQDRRHRADYDPNFAITTSETKSAIDMAETAITAFSGADKEQFRLFLILLLFQARS